MNLFYKSIKISLIVFAFTIITSISKAEYPNTSIGIIDLNIILTDAKAAKDAEKEIEKIANKINDEIKKTDDEIIGEQSKLIDSQAVMAPEAFEVKRQEYEKKVQNYEITRREKLMSIDALIATSRNKVLEALKPILEEISNEKGITIIHEKNTVLLNADKMDITEEALKKLNKALPSIEVTEN